PTPSAAAETVLPDRAEVWRRVDGLALALNAWAAGQAGQSRAAIERSLQRLRAALPDASAPRHRLGALVLAAEVAMERLTSRHDERLGSFTAQLRSLDPRRTLARGYAVVQMREDKQAVTSVKQVQGKERLTVHVQDGSFPAQVSKQYGF
ncbi:MAG TPA: exodeoxyribonuclease VII large subunit, partial [Dehalococcoidia bacterium]|nr:exodeoxyribonuclease VII large subunit [Dehalococcoidia bacterium]